MATRMKSPSYPSIPLGQAIEIIEKIYSSERTNPVDREVAAQAMGYTGITGRSAKMLSDLNQYGLLEKIGKNEIRVSNRAVDILYPDTAEAQAAALEAAATEPELFQRVKERFPAGAPSEAALRSFFLREGFTDAAIPSAKRAYLETIRFAQEPNESESNGHEPAQERESQKDQSVNKGDKVRFERQHINSVDSSGGNDADETSRRKDKPAFTWADNQIWLGGGVIGNQREADEVIAFIQALRPMLKADEVRSDSVSAAIGGDDVDDADAALEGLASDAGDNE